MGRLLQRLSQSNVSFVVLEADDPSLSLSAELLVQKRYYMTLCSQKVTHTLLKTVSKNKMSIIIIVMS